MIYLPSTLVHRVASFGKPTAVTLSPSMWSVSVTLALRRRPNVVASRATNVSRCGVDRAGQTGAGCGQDHFGPAGSAEGAGVLRELSRVDLEFWPGLRSSLLQQGDDVLLVATRCRCQCVRQRSCGVADRRRESSWTWRHAPAATAAMSAPSLPFGFFVNSSATISGVLRCSTHRGVHRPGQRRRMVESCPDVDVGAAIEQQQPDDLQVPAIAGVRQCRPVVAKPGVDVHTLVQKLPNSGCIALAGGFQERVGFLEVVPSLRGRLHRKRPEPAGSIAPARRLPESTGLRFPRIRGAPRRSASITPSYSLKLPRWPDLMTHTLLAFASERQTAVNPAFRRLQPIQGPRRCTRNPRRPAR